MSAVLAAIPLPEDSLTNGSGSISKDKHLLQTPGQMLSLKSVLGTDPPAAAWGWTYFLSHHRRRMGEWVWSCRAPGGRRRNMDDCPALELKS